MCTVYMYGDINVIKQFQLIFLMDKINLKTHMYENVNLNGLTKINSTDNPWKNN